MSGADHCFVPLSHAPREWDNGTRTAETGRKQVGQAGQHGVPAPRAMTRGRGTGAITLPKLVGVLQEAPEGSIG